ncbi:MAG: hypothetical protein E7370_00185 [Clostridiales bacterium]|nr:hypothetical protein [Clostridiales bacterium]
MKKKNLAVLLIIPFLISLLGVVVADVTYSLLDVDISSIIWTYDDVEFFQMDRGEYILEAEGVTPTGYPAGEGNELVWTVKDKTAAEDGSQNNLATVIERDGDYYLEPLAEGEIILTCSNAKGNVFRRLDAVIFKHGAVAISPVVSPSHANVDSTIYYGQFDISRQGTAQKIAAKIAYRVKIIPENLANDVEFSYSDNVSVGVNTIGNGEIVGDISVIGTGEVTVTAQVTGQENIAPYSFNFEVVENGVNVYNYDDLMYCTNDSTTGGEIVVLRRNFESSQTLYELDENGYVIIKNGKAIPKVDDDGNTVDAECFGKINGNAGGSMQYDFSLKKLPTTYNRKYIDQWNEFAAGNAKFKDIPFEINIGVYVTKDFYGNGYTLNMHNLTHPYKKKTVNDVDTYELASYNLFRGPLPYYTLGDPNAMALVTAYGQDNAGVYVHGDGIVLNDVNFKNCDEVTVMETLDYVGNVLEVDGDNVTIKNSILSNGKNVVRSFSSFNLNITNCLIQNSRNFLFVTGANECKDVNPDKHAYFSTIDGTGSQVGATVKSYLNLENQGNGNGVLNTFVQKDDFDIEVMRKAMHSIQSALDYEDAESLMEAGNTTITDTFFYNSGVASICFESQFNGPFLYNSSPSFVSTNLKDFLGDLIPLMPSNVGGTSYPVSVSINGDTRFYDYKNINDWDISGLIKENISAMASVLGQSVNINIDRIFPLKSILKNQAGSQYSKNGYMNVPVAYYGGGINHSKLYVNNLDCKDHLSGDIVVDLLDEYLSYKNSGLSFKGITPELMLKTVVTVSGTSPFKFRLMDNSGYLFNQTPNVSDLFINAQGE